MSIAMEEAVRIYPFKGHSAEAYERCMVSRVDYVKGRTAPVTDAEAMAAVEELEYHTYAYTPSHSRSVACSCGEKFTGKNGSESYRMWTIHVGTSVFEAARELVAK